jgi:phosphoenolpyruvate carboxylase
MSCQTLIYVLNYLMMSLSLSVSFQDSQKNAQVKLDDVVNNLDENGSGTPLASPRLARSGSNLLLAGMPGQQGKMLAELNAPKSSFRKLLEPSRLRPGTAPYRVVLGHIKDKVTII